jgi:hypothetical protein
MPRKSLVVAMVTTFSVFAAAAPPFSIVGTWSGVANQTAVVLVVTAQETTAAACKRIIGNLHNLPSGGASNIQGFYCPATGRIGLLRKNVTNNDTFQSYSGNIGDTATTLRMTGVFAEFNLAGHLGEYNFSLTK